MTKKVTFCPYCGSQEITEGVGAFLEMGDFDGKQYESEGDADGVLCLSCNGEFWVNGPAMDNTDASICDRVCISCHEEIGSEETHCPHCGEDQDPANDICETCGGPDASSSDAVNGQCPSCVEAGCKS